MSLKRFWCSTVRSDPFPPPELPDEGLARPVVAGVVATICFLAAAVLFSTLAACFVNKQHRHKLKRKPGQFSCSSVFKRPQMEKSVPVEENPNLNGFFFCLFQILPCL